MHFNVKNCIGEIGKIVKNEILASTSVLSYLGGEMIKVSGLGTYMGYFEMNGDLLGLKFNKMSENVLLKPFLTTSNAWLLQSTSEYQKDIICDVDFIKGYNIYQYLFGIHLCSVQAKCWKLSKM